MDSKDLQYMLYIVKYIFQNVQKHHNLSVSWFKAKKWLIDGENKMYKVDKIEEFKAWALVKMIKIDP